MELGERIKQRRVELKLSLRDLAEQAELTASYLSQVERNLSVPSIESLRKISRALSIPMFYFFLETDSPSPVVRRGERRTLVIPNTDVTYELLTPNLNRKMEVILAQSHPSSGDIPLMHHTDTEECIFVLEGMLEIEIGDELYQLDTGDSIYFEGILLQRITPIGTTTARYLSIVTPPIF
jgi:transcriptional regulator with XRE-family HTH domain